MYIQQSKPLKSLSEPSIALCDGRNCREIPIPPDTFERDPPVVCCTSHYRIYFILRQSIRRVVQDNHPATAIGRQYIHTPVTRHSPSKGRNDIFPLPLDLETAFVHILDHFIDSLSDLKVPSFALSKSFGYEFS